MECKSVSDNTISFEHEEFGHIATLSLDGLKADRDRYPEKTSREFAQMIYESISKFVRDVQFERGKSPVKMMIAGTPALEMGAGSFVLHATAGMTHFDQWVAIHLEQMWKERRF
jgi:hypothetical protein